MESAKKSPILDYDPLFYKQRTDVEPEFGKAYEPVLPTESEIRYLGNRNRRCFYYVMGLEVCKYEVLSKHGSTFLPCKDVMDAMWRCFTDNHYGKSIEDAPEYTKPYKDLLYDCFFTKHIGMDFCWPYFSGMVRTIYRRPDSKLSRWY